MCSVYGCACVLVCVWRLICATCAREVLSSPPWRVEERGRRTARRKKRRETVGGISGQGRAIKREGERGNMRDRGNMGGTYRFKGRGWNSLGEDVKKLSLLGLAPLTEILAGVHWTCLLCGWSIYHSVSNTFSPLCCFVSHPSLGSIESSAAPSPDTLIIRLWITSFAKCNKWTRICFSLETGGETCQQIRD